MYPPEDYQPDEVEDISSDYDIRAGDERVTISFIVTGEQYNQLKLRLPRHGDRSDFLRAVVVMFLEGKISVESTRKF